MESGGFLRIFPFYVFFPLSFIVLSGCLQSLAFQRDENGNWLEDIHVLDEGAQGRVELDISATRSFDLPGQVLASGSAARTVFDYDLVGGGSKVLWVGATYDASGFLEAQTRVFSGQTEGWSDNIDPGLSVGGDLSLGVRAVLDPSDSSRFWAIFANASGLPSQSEVFSFNSTSESWNLENSYSAGFDALPIFFPELDATGTGMGFALDGSGGDALSIAAISSVWTPLKTLRTFDNGGEIAFSGSQNAVQTEAYDDGSTRHFLWRTESEEVDTELAVGDAHACAIVGGDLFCWGDNSAGQVTGASGDGGVFTTPRKVDLAALTGLSFPKPVEVDAGDSFTCVRVEDREGSFSGARVLCFGAESDTDALGNNSGTEIFVSSAVSAPLTGVSSIGLGAGFGCALLDSGEVWCWGDDTYRQLGQGGAISADSDVALQVKRGFLLTPVDDAHLLKVGESEACIVRGAVGSSSLALACWGRSLIDPASSVSTRANAIDDSYPNGYDYSDLTLTYGLLCFRSETDPDDYDPSQIGLFCLGKNDTPDYPQLGLAYSSTYTSYSPYTLCSDSLTCVTSVPNRVQFYYEPLLSKVGASSANILSCSRRIGQDQMVCWGMDDQGLTGNGNATNSYTGPTVVRTGDTPIQVEAGLGFACGLWESGEVRCWGKEYAQGQLGIGVVSASVYSPQSVSFGLDVCRSGACLYAASSGVKVVSDANESVLEFASTTDGAGRIAAVYLQTTPEIDPDEDCLQDEDEETIAIRCNVRLFANVTSASGVWQGETRIDDVESAGVELEASFHATTLPEASDLVPASATLLGRMSAFVRPAITSPEAGRFQVVFPMSFWDSEGETLYSGLFIKEYDVSRGGWISGLSPVFLEEVSDSESMDRLVNSVAFQGDVIAVQRLLDEDTFGLQVWETTGDLMLSLGSGLCSRWNFWCQVTKPKLALTSDDKIVVAFPGYVDDTLSDEIHLLSVEYDPN